MYPYWHSKYSPKVVSPPEQLRNPEKLRGFPSCQLSLFRAEVKPSEVAEKGSANADGEYRQAAPNKASRFSVLMTRI